MLLNQLVKSSEVMGLSSPVQAGAFSTSAENRFIVNQIKNELYSLIKQAPDSQAKEYLKILAEFNRMSRKVNRQQMVKYLQDNQDEMQVNLNELLSLIEAIKFEEKPKRRTFFVGK
jgi:hypothetical protein